MQGGDVGDALDQAMVRPAASRRSALVDGHHRLLAIPVAMPQLAAPVAVDAAAPPRFRQRHRKTVPSNCVPLRPIASAAVQP